MNRGVAQLVSVDVTDARGEPLVGQEALWQALLGHRQEIAWLRRDVGTQEAILQRLRDQYERVSDPSNSAIILHHLGVVAEEWWQWDEAEDYYRQSLAIFERLGERYGQARCLHHIGLCLHALGDRPQARTHWQRALAIYTEIGLPAADDVRNLLAEVPDDAPTTT